RQGDAGLDAALLVRLFRLAGPARRGRLRGGVSHLHRRLRDTAGADDSRCLRRGTDRRLSPLDAAALLLRRAEPEVELADGCRAARGPDPGLTDSGDSLRRHLPEADN